MKKVARLDFLSGNAVDATGENVARPIRGVQTFHNKNAIFLTYFQPNPVILYIAVTAITYIGNLTQNSDWKTVAMGSS